MTNVERILSVFAGCCTATDNTVYFPVESIGCLVHSALAMDREIKDQAAEIERLHRQIKEMETKG